MELPEFKPSVKTPEPRSPKHEANEDPDFNEDGELMVIWSDEDEEDEPQVKSEPIVVKTTIPSSIPIVVLLSDDSEDDHLVLIDYPPLEQPLSEEEG